MQFADDTPPQGVIPEVYPKQPPINLLEPELLRPNNFFAFEGIDGAGKSSLIAEVVAICRAREVGVRVMKLGRSDVTVHALERAKWLNSNPMTFSLLNWVSLYEQATQARADFNSDVRVLVDRYILTLKVRGLLEGMSTDFMKPLEANLPRPSILFFIDCDPDLCCQRILSSHREITYFEAGSRIVNGPGQRMLERDPSARQASPGREAGLRSHLHRMRAALKALAEREDNVVMVDNSGPPQRALAVILAAMGCRDRDQSPERGQSGATADPASRCAP
jgi:thymidylate kinase